jgi:hypothetical protein
MFFYESMYISKTYKTGSQRIFVKLGFFNWSKLGFNNLSAFEVIYALGVYLRNSNSNLEWVVLYVQIFFDSEEKLNQKKSSQPSLTHSTINYSFIF